MESNQCKIVIDFIELESDDKGIYYNRGGTYGSQKFNIFRFKSIPKN